MADTRTLREKLEAMASQTASPNEAANARRLLQKRVGSAPRTETPGSRLREAIRAQADRRGLGFVVFRRQGDNRILKVDIDELEYVFYPEAKELILDHRSGDVTLVWAYDGFQYSVVDLYYGTPEALGQ